MHIQPIFVSPDTLFSLFDDAGTFIDEFYSYGSADLAMQALSFVPVVVADCGLDPHDPPHPGEPVPANEGDTI